MGDTPGFFFLEEGGSGPADTTQSLTLDHRGARS